MNLKVSTREARLPVRTAERSSGRFDIAAFVDSFPVLSEAVGGVAGLRQLIVDMGVRGMLTPQNKVDEDGATLLVRGWEAKCAEGMAGRRGRQDQPICDTAPFDIPSSWTWARLSDVAVKLGAGSTPLGGKSVYQSHGVRFLRSQNVWNDGLRLSDVARIDRMTHAKMSGTHVAPGDLLLNITGASIGRCAVVPDDFDEGNVSQHVAIVRLAMKELRGFIHLCVLSSYFQRMIMDVQVGVSREGLSMKRLQDFPVVIPPIAEQKRIVAKVDELMQMLDGLETKQAKKRETQVRLRLAAVGALSLAEGPAEFNAAWNRVVNNFDVLFDRAEDISPLRRAILELGTQGGLSDPGKRSIGELPPGWASAMVGEIADKVTDGDHATPRRATEGHFLLSARNVRDGAIALDDVDFVPADEFARMRRRCDPNIGDVLLSCSGSVGRVAVVDRNDAYVMVRSAAMIRPKRDLVGPQYLHYALRSQSAQQQITEKSRASAQANLFLGRIKEIQLAIPPLAEQQRIVAKVEQLMKLCDDLEAKLHRSETTASKLVEAAVAEMVA